MGKPKVSKVNATSVTKFTSSANNKRLSSSQTSNLTSSKMTNGGSGTSIFKNAQLLSQGGGGNVASAVPQHQQFLPADIAPSMQTQMLNLSAMASLMGMNAFFSNFSKLFGSGNNAHQNHLLNSMLSGGDAATATAMAAAIMWAVNGAAAQNSPSAQNFVGSPLAAAVNGGNGNNFGGGANLSAEMNDFLKLCMGGGGALSGSGGGDNNCSMSEMMLESTTVGDGAEGANSNNAAAMMMIGREQNGNSENLMTENSLSKNSNGKSLKSIQKSFQSVTNGSSPNPPDKPKTPVKKPSRPKASKTAAAAAAVNRPPPRNMNNWILLGKFDTEDEMHEVRSREKVSKRRTEQLKNGVKVRYRCNKWKRTKCGYQMYSFFPVGGQIELYETGEHDHTGKRMVEFELTKNGSVKGTPSAPSPELSPTPFFTEDVFSSLFAAAECYKSEEVSIHDIRRNSPKSSTDDDDDEPVDLKLRDCVDQPETAQGSSWAMIDLHSFIDRENPRPISFSLRDEVRLKELQTTASNFNLRMDRLDRGGQNVLLKFYASANGISAAAASKQSLKLLEKSDKSTIFVVETLDNNNFANLECWRADNWSQFLWAFKGKCANYFAQNR